MKKIDNYISIYEQRYETYRHLDKLRWYIFQIGVSVVGVIISFHTLDNLTLLGAGSILTSSGFIMLKINHGIDKNNKELKKAAKRLGDKSIPDIHNRSKRCSVSWLVCYVLTVIGIASLICGLIGFLICH